MEKIITFENLKYFAYVNTNHIKGDIKGIVIFFEGLGGQVMYYKVDHKDGAKWGEQGVLFVYPYNNPWNWMNRRAIDTTDEIIDVLFDHYNLPDNTPIISSGHSMGGECALVYSHYARRTPKACVANCPVCDMPYHYTERFDLPRTLYSAFGAEEGTLDEVLKRYTPLHLAQSMPNIPYYIIHCGNDESVNIDLHSKKFVDAMRPSHNVTFLIDEGRPHCELSDEMKKKWDGFITNEIGL